MSSSRTSSPSSISLSQQSVDVTFFSAGPNFPNRVRHTVSHFHSFVQLPLYVAVIDGFVVVFWSWVRVQEVPKGNLKESSRRLTVLRQLFRCQTIVLASPPAARQRSQRNGSVFDCMTANFADVTVIKKSRKLNLLRDSYLFSTSIETK
jgi:hypothetical protein